MISENIKSWFPNRIEERIIHEGGIEVEESGWSGQDGTTGSDAGGNSGMESWRERLAEYRREMKDGMSLLLAVPNRLGIRYFAGYEDDECDVYFAGPAGYAKQALSLSEYKEALREAGFTDIKVYYPYPDYGHPYAIYSDERLPHPGELKNIPKINNRDRYMLFDEKRMMETFANEGVFQQFSDTFIIEAVPDGSHKRGQAADGERIIYTKFSPDRDDRFKIRTDIVVKPDGTKVVRKYPLNDAAAEHIRRLGETCAKCNMPKSMASHTQKSEGSTFITFCPVTMCDGYAEFPWIEGVSLQDILLEHLKHGRDAEAKTLIDQYIGKVNAICNAEIYNADLIFSNIIVNKCIWTVIDYEWTFDEKVPPEWIIYRAIHYLCAESGDLREEELLRLAGQAHANAAQQPNGEDAISHFKDYERRFQDYIRGSAESLADIALRESGNIIPFEGNRSIEERIAEQLINAKEMSVRKLIYNIDDRRNADGRISVRGWACGKVSGHEYIPASLSVFESDGMPAPAAIARIEREDVADVVGDKSGFPCYGFDIRMRIEKGRSYVLRIKTGKRYVDLNLND